MLLCAPGQRRSQGCAATDTDDSALSSAQADRCPAKVIPALTMDWLLMGQHRHEPERSGVGEPPFGQVGACLELRRDVICVEPTAFQFHRNYPGCNTIIFCHEQIVAPRLPRESEGLAVQIYQDTRSRRTRHRNRAPLLVAATYATLAGDLSGHVRNQSSHFVSISCSRL